MCYRAFQLYGHHGCHSIKWLIFIIKSMGISSILLYLKAFQKICLKDQCLAVLHYFLIGCSRKLQFNLAQVSGHGLRLMKCLCIRRGISIFIDTSQAGRWLKAYHMTSRCPASKATSVPFYPSSVRLYPPLSGISAVWGSG